jgi:hypothetical protein
VRWLGGGGMRRPGGGLVVAAVTSTEGQWQPAGGPMVFDLIFLFFSKLICREPKSTHDTPLP